MNFQIIFFTLGFLLMILGTALTFPFLMDYWDNHHNSAAFGWSAITAIFFGGGFCISNRNFSSDLTIRHAFVMTVASWLLMSIFCAVPFYVSDLNISFTDALFESVSGITTTGATVLTGLEGVSRGIHLWRAITQWIGGIGIIAFAMILLPFLKIGGMQLFRSESSDKSEKIMPKTNDIVMSIIQIYAILTAFCALSYYLLGMSRFDALIHAMTTIPTGGFSTHDASFGYFDSYALQMAGTFFMFISGVPFILLVQLFYQRQAAFWQDSQVRTYAYIILATTFALTIYIWIGGQTLTESFKISAFNVVSVITTTGYATTDYSLLGPFAVAVFFFITYLGGCAGSTAGGLKMLRINVAFQALTRHLKTLIYPNGVFSVTYQGKSLGHEVINAVMGFLFLYVFFNVVFTIALAWTGLDFMTAITGTATAMANVGPGLGDIIGPAGNFSTINDTAKWILSFAMLLGRLEIMTILVLFSVNFWKD